MKEVIIIKKYICIIVTILIFVNIIYLPATSFAEETTCITYTGSTTANYGYKPNCKFTLNSIKENRCGQCLRSPDPSPAPYIQV